jgi:BNR repeat protein
MSSPVRRGARVALAILALSSLAGSTIGIAAAAGPAPSFTAPVRLGFPNGDDWEPSIAADRSGRVYMVTTHYVGYAGSNTGDVDPTCPDCASPHMVIQVSNDNGATWSAPRVLSRTDTRQDDPQIVVDAADGRTVYAAFMEGNKSSMYVARSDDFGATFTPVLVEPIERGLDKIALAARNGKVYLVYHSQQKIFASISLDRGDTWKVVQPVNNTNSKLGVSLPSGAAIDSHGTAYFAWNGVNAPGQAKSTINLFVTKTSDAGTTWTTSIVDVSQAAASCDCGGWDYWGAQLALDVDDADRVYVLWNANRVKYGPQRMYFAKSTNGVSWTAPVDVSKAPVGSNNVFPAIVAGAAGDVRIAWTDDRNGFDSGSNDANARWNTYYRSSANGGSNWSGEAKLSAFVAGYTYKFATPKDGYLQPYGDYFEIDINAAGKTVAAWGEGNSYFGPGNIWFARGT